MACFPFDDHNCPPLQLVAAFCQSAYSWLKGDLENVVVVHCKAGMARTGLMITCLLMYLKVLMLPFDGCVKVKNEVFYIHYSLIDTCLQIYTNTINTMFNHMRMIMKHFSLQKCWSWIGDGKLIFSRQCT